MANLGSEASAFSEAIPATPAETHAALTVETTSTPGTQAGWVSRQLRNFVVIVLTLAMLYLALVEKNTTAITALITAWTWSAGGMFQERASLKVPGRDS